MNSREGETHDGLATFRYRAGTVSSLRFQIIQQTAPYEVPQIFCAWGLVSSNLDATEPPHLAGLTAAAAGERADRIPVRAWEELAAREGHDKLAGFNSALPENDFILSGLFYRGIFYLHSSQSAGGPLPWLDRTRFGVWSVTKSAVTTTALLRLAEKFGNGVLSLRIAGYVSAPDQAKAWQNVTFADCINMTTGFGSGSTQTFPNDIFDGEIEPHYADWYDAASLTDKLSCLFRFSMQYPWPPGRVARYRDEDMFLLGVAMDRFLKSKEGAQASIASMLQREVFEPIGIYGLPMNVTLESDGTSGQPLMAFGAYPTLGDMVKIGRLYAQQGRWKGHTLLQPDLTARIVSGKNPVGLPTGKKSINGEIRYHLGFWEIPRPAHGADSPFYPAMIGYGGNIVALPNKEVVAIRLAHSQTDGGSVNDTTGMARVANALGKPCERGP